MKPKYFLALGLLVLGLGSCGESFFEQYPSNNITEGNFYKTDDDFNQGVVACYAKLKTQMSFHLTTNIAANVCSCGRGGISTSTASSAWCPSPAPW